LKAKADDVAQVSTPYATQFTYHCTG